MSTRRPRPFLPFAVASVLLAPALMAPLAPAAAAAQADPERERTFMRITAPMVDVRSGPQDYYYGFFTLAEDDIVEVVEERANGFTAILTTGPRFVAGYALLRVRDDESFRIAGPERTTATGRSARTGMSEQRLQVLYPNIGETDLLNRSWRMIRRIEPRTEIQVMGSPITGEGVTLHRIPLPKDALGYVPTTVLAPATEAEAADFLAWEQDPAAWLARRRAEAERQRLAAEAEKAEADRLALAAAAAAARAEANEPAAPVATSERTVPETTTPPTRTDESSDPAGATTPPVTGTTETGTEAGTGTADPAGTGSGDATDVDDVGDADATNADRTADADADADTDTESADGDADATAAEAGGATDADEPSGSAAVSTLPPAERLDALEKAFDLLRDEDIRRVEVTPLAGLYRAFAADMTTEEPDKATYATTRARQLELWARLQAQRDRIEALRADVSQTNVALAEAAQSIQTQLGFSAVGRLASSRIFDGTRLPRLLRLEALDSGRTIAYVRDIGRLDLDSRVGEIVGLFGERTYDPGLQLDVLDAERVRSVRLDVEDGGAGPAGE